MIMWRSSLSFLASFARHKAGQRTLLGCVPGYPCCTIDSSIRNLSTESDDGSKLRIYTRTGDKGVSSNFAGQRLPKDDHIFEALGSNDELSSFLGLAREFCLESEHSQIATKLQEIQCLLQDVGSHIATPRNVATQKKLARTTFSASHVDKLEKWIDEMDEELPPLTAFILPSGGKSGSVLHVARTICRRTERRVVPLYKSGQIDHDVAKYLNRLSDFLFTAARFVSHREGQSETVYKKPE